MPDTSQQERRPSTWRALDQAPDACRWARKQAELTLTAAAAELGISFGQLGEIERGTRNANVALQRRMAELYNCPVVVLARSIHEEPATAP